MFVYPTTFFKTTSTAFYPSDVAGSIYGMDADKLSFNDDDVVDNSGDQSSVGTNEFLEITSGDDPIYKTSIKNGHAVLRFSTNDSLILAAGLAHGNASYTIYTVEQVTSLGNGKNPVYGISASANESWKAVSSNTASNSSRWRPAGSNLSFTKASPVLAINTWYVVKIVVDSSSVGRVYYSKDGAAFVEATNTRTGNDAFTPTHLGRSQSNYFPGDKMKVWSWNVEIADGSANGDLLDTYFKDLIT